jgi:CO/xanthine dehydrogenase Mo-binding subunit
MAIGQPVDRLDGRAKVTGAARYTGDVTLEGLVYGAFASSPVARGRITALDTRAAERAANVIRVLTSRDMPRFKPVNSPPAGQSYFPLQDDRVRYEGQPIALVVASTLEDAQHAAGLVRASIASEPISVDFEEGIDHAITVKSFFEADTVVGDVPDAFEKAPVRLEATYRTADRHHCWLSGSGERRRPRSRGGVCRRARPACQRVRRTRHRRIGGSWRWVGDSERCVACDRTAGAAASGSRRRCCSKRSWHS